MKTKLYYHDSGNVGLRVCVQSFMITHMQWFKGNNMYIHNYSHQVKLVIIDYEYATLP